MKSTLNRLRRLNLSNNVIAQRSGLAIEEFEVNPNHPLLERAFHFKGALINFPVKFAPVKKSSIPKKISVLQKAQNVFRNIFSRRKV